MLVDATARSSVDRFAIRRSTNKRKTWTCSADDNFPPDAQDCNSSDSETHEHLANRHGVSILCSLIRVAVYRQAIVPRDAQTRSMTNDKNSCPDDGYPMKSDPHASDGDVRWECTNPWHPRHPGICRRCKRRGYPRQSRERDAAVCEYCGNEWVPSVHTPLDD